MAYPCIFFSVLSGGRKSGLTQVRFSARNREAISEAAKVYLDQGFTAVKFGWGVFGKDKAQDLRLVEAARRTLGEANDLLIDTGWFVERTPKEAIQLVRSLEQFKPFFVEELLHPESYAGYREVAGSVDTLIACGEQESTEWGFQQLIDQGGVDVLQPDLTRCGGFTVARKIVFMAERANRLVIPHSWCSDLLTAASLHLNAFQRRAVFVEFNTSQGPLSREIVRNPLKLEDGYSARCQKVLASVSRSMTKRFSDTGLTSAIFPSLLSNSQK